jgi:hypothetical protein
VELSPWPRAEYLNENGQSPTPVKQENVAGPAGPKAAVRKPVAVQPNTGSGGQVAFRS